MAGGARYDRMLPLPKLCRVQSVLTVEASPVAVLRHARLAFEFVDGAPAADGACALALSGFGGAERQFVRAPRTCGSARRRAV
ncbi:hypothetical protein GPNCGGLF_LOCUS606 [Methylorubrum aminovorans]